ncbi:HlyD family efflux transporter periplasmic adaptor subunit [Olivibacter sp. CPCC 100613]|uniref:HlyD family secretion protein n=1 Tax=Olivibacter sp. CPCC 100613 TaxID=3079931 RepID=UPI002FF7B286
MSMPIYSVETISNTSIVYTARVKRTTQIIYLGILLLFMLAFASLPLVKINISVKGSGLLQSSIEKTDISIPVNGRLVYFNLKDNQKTTLGDTLLIIDGSSSNKQDLLVKGRQQEIGSFIKDLHVLIRQANNEDFSPPNLQSGQYLAIWQQYIQEIDNARIAKDQAENTFNRYSKLYKKKMLSSAEYDKYDFEYKQASSALVMVSRKYKAQWQTEVNQLQNELRQLVSQQIDINEQKKQFVVTAPIDGSIQNLAGLQKGTYVFANQKVAEISPDTTLLAFCYINPSDIGLIKKEQEVRFQIDAFNYNQWGLLTGRVIDISDDIVMLNDKQPVFKVRCVLNKDHLILKNGYKGYVKKGMSFTARFSVTERTLFQLLYDKVDNWLNPNIKGAS